MLDSVRLTFRRHETSDLADCAALWGDAEVARFIGGQPSTPEEVWQRILRYAGLWTLTGCGYWVVHEKRSGRFVGELGLADFKRAISPSLDAPEIGWALAPWAWGQGFATEAVRAALGWLEAEKGPTRTVCLISPENRASVRVAEKCGYRKWRDATYKGAAVTLFER